MTERTFEYCAERWEGDAHLPWVKMTTTPGIRAGKTFTLALPGSTCEAIAAWAQDAGASYEEAVSRILWYGVEWAEDHMLLGRTSGGDGPERRYHDAEYSRWRPDEDLPLVEFSDAIAPDPDRNPDVWAFSVHMGIRDAALLDAAGAELDMHVDEVVSRALAGESLLEFARRGHRPIRRAMSPENEEVVRAWVEDRERRRRESSAERDVTSSPTD